MLTALLCLGLALADRPSVYLVPGEPTAPPMEGFLEIVGDPSEVIASLVPSAPPMIPTAPAPVDGSSEAGAAEAGAAEAETAPSLPVRPGPSFPPTGDLTIRNDRSSWARVTVEGVDIGVIGPLSNGHLHAVRSGTYEVVLTFQNGFAVTERLLTEIAPPEAP